MTRISFLGATETVTGSKYLVETDRARVLVDCGLFQGVKDLRERNWKPLPFAPSSLDAVLLTHAHIDHTGHLPRLCAGGFRGRVHCTPGTRDLLGILLPDSGKLQEEAARHAVEHGYSRHREPLPLYTRAQAEASLQQLDAHEFGRAFEPAPGVEAVFTRAGHIVGSACLSLRTPTETIAFSGDVGRPEDPIMKPPDPLPRADYLLVESTYGDRRHPGEAAADTIARLIHEVVEKAGTILVPAFAVGRAQHLLHVLAVLRRERRIVDLPVFLDSPMAIDATKLFCRHKADHRLTEDECHAMCSVARYTPTADESKALSRQPGPLVIVSASGMATGGRILHHLRRCLPDPRNAVLLVGFQAAGTRGRSLADGAEELKIQGQYVRVRARVVQVPGLSAHADYAELLDWLERSTLSPRRVFVTHGEPSAADAFRRRLRERFGWEARVPRDGSTWDLE